MFRTDRYRKKLEVKGGNGPEKMFSIKLDVRRIAFTGKDKTAVNLQREGALGSLTELGRRRAPLAYGGEGCLV